MPLAGKKRPRGEQDEWTDDDSTALSAVERDAEDLRKSLTKLHEQPEGLRFQQQVGTNARLSGRHAKESAGLPKAGRHDAFGKRFSTHRHRDAGDQLVQIERLEDVVVGSGVKACDLVADSVSGRGDKDRHAIPTIAQILQL